MRYGVIVKHLTQNDFDEMGISEKVKDYPCGMPFKFDSDTDPSGCIPVKNPSSAYVPYWCCFSLNCAIEITEKEYECFLKLQNEKKGSQL